jgi:hypothetical protein
VACGGLWDGRVVCYVTTLYKLRPLFGVELYIRVIALGEFGRIWEQGVEAYFKVGIISRHSSGKTGEKHGECLWRQSVSWSELVPSISLTQIRGMHVGETNENRKTEIKIRNIAPLSYKLADMLPMV